MKPQSILNLVPVGYFNVSVQIEKNAKSLKLTACIRQHCKYLNASWKIESLS